MSVTTATLRKKITGAKDLQSVVRTMKAVSASNISQYEQSVHALTNYIQTVEMGLSASLRKNTTKIISADHKQRPEFQNAIVFGSDQGLVGQFNDVVADFARTRLSEFPGKSRVWAVGERVRSLLADTGINVSGMFEIPASIKGITPLVGEILVKTELQLNQDSETELFLFYNRPRSAATYEPVAQRLLPLDQEWLHSLTGISWPNGRSSEIFGSNTTTLRCLIDEYLFVSLFRASAESLASENASLLAAMQRADQNIDELLKELNGTFHRLRKEGIDEELFDVISSFDTLKEDSR